MIQGMRRYLPIALIVLVYLVVGSLYAVLTPDWQAPDEPAHYNVIRQLAEGTFPVIEPADYNQDFQGEAISSGFDPAYDVPDRYFSYEDWQPPLYYLLLVPVYQLFGGTLEPLRLASLLMGAGVILLAYGVARQVLGREDWALAAAAFLAFLPQHIALMASLNNDALAELLIAALLYLLVRGESKQSTVNSEQLSVIGEQNSKPKTRNSELETQHSALSTQSSVLSPHPFPTYFALTEEKPDLNAIHARLVQPDVGAIATFSGYVRGATQRDGLPPQTLHLEYEAYSEMAEQRMAQIAQEIWQKWPLVKGIAIVQRIGKLEISEPTTLVACAAGHRDQGIFEAARYGIDRLKEIVPVWKKEVGTDKSVWVEGHYQPTEADNL